MVAPAAAAALVVFRKLRRVEFVDIDSPGFTPLLLMLRPQTS